MTVTKQERIEVLEEVLGLMDACAQRLRSLDDIYIKANCLPNFEGRKRGWLGTFVRDYLEEALAQAKGEGAGEGEDEALDQEQPGSLREEELVAEKDACPGCGERRIDWLGWEDDERVVCATCGRVYEP